MCVTTGCLVKVALQVAFALAARTNLKVPVQPAAVDVMHTISALIQAHGTADLENEDRFQQLNSLRKTPGVIEAMNDILTKDIQTMEDKITGGHEQTQGESGRLITVLETETQKVLDDKASADDADNAYFACVESEKSSRVAVEGAEQALADAQESTVKPCQLQKDRAPFKWAPDAAALVFGCDFSAQGDCDTQMQNYQTQLDHMMSDLENDIKESTQKYNEAKRSCDAAKADVVQKQSALSAAQDAWGDKRKECLFKHDALLVLMCKFGSQLQSKCEAAQAHANFLAAVDEKQGGEYSHVDRVAEWKATAVSKCMIAKLIAGEKLDDTALESCAKKGVFDEDVGVVNRQDKKFSELMSPDKFTCKETHIEFRGVTWTVPAGEAPHSSEYTTKPFKPAVDLTVGAAPFDFCQKGTVNIIKRDLIKGEMDIREGFVLVDGNPHNDGSMCGFEQEKDLDEICADPTSKEVAGIRCCSKSNYRERGASVCDKGRCTTYTHAEAQSACEGKGMRLCQANELLLGYTSGTGCWYDHHYVWSSKKCGMDVEDYLEPPPAGHRPPPKQKDVKRGYVVVDGNPNSDGSACGFEQQKGLDILCADPEDTAMAGTRCCHDTSRRGKSICNSGKCHTHTHAEAKKSCEDAGMRLCMANEVMAGYVQGTGCWYDHSYVWTNKTCGSEVEDYEEPEIDVPQAPTQKPVKSGFLIVDGNPSSDGNACGFRQVPGVDEVCADPTDVRMAGTRCCSDDGKAASICTAGHCQTHTFEEAKAGCEQKSMRLCTAAELHTGVTKGTGCWYDHHYVWSNTTCSSP